MTDTFEIAHADIPTDWTLGGMGWSRDTNTWWVTLNREGNIRSVHVYGHPTAVAALRAAIAKVKEVGK